MSSFVDSSGLPSRRTVIGAAFWSVPVIAVVTATPAFAGSVSPSINALRLSKLDLKLNGDSGPIEIGLQVDYSSPSTHYPDTISFAWILTVSGPDVRNHTVKSGAAVVSRNTSWQKTCDYPDAGSNLATGKYDFTFTVTVAGSGSSSRSGKVKV